MKNYFIFMLLLPILIVTYPSYAMTDAELTAKYHGDMSAIESDLSSGVLQCSDLPDNIKSGSCTDDAHKIVLPDGSTAQGLNLSWVYWSIPLVVVIALIVGATKLMFHKSSPQIEEPYYEHSAPIHDTDDFFSKQRELKNKFTNERVTSDKSSKKTSDRLKGKTHD